MWLKTTEEKGQKDIQWLTKYYRKKENHGWSIMNPTKKQE
jgi:hypothetical protein